MLLVEVKTVDACEHTSSDAKLLARMLNWAMETDIFGIAVCFLLQKEKTVQS